MTRLKLQVSSEHEQSVEAGRKYLLKYNEKGGEKGLKPIAQQSY